MGFWEIVGLIWLISYLINEVCGLIIDKQFYIIRTWKRYGREAMISSGWMLILLQPFIAVASIADCMDGD